MISLEEFKHCVRSIAIFKALSEQELLAVYDVSRLEQFQKGQLLIREGIANYSLYYLISGKVEVESYGVRVATVGAGGSLGEVSVAGLEVATADVVAIGSVSTLAIPIKVIKEIAEKNHLFFEQLHDSAMSRLLG
ncbi:MAG: cyclic nucleotide-binding domain-containing protein [Ghiorsea sp.]